MRAALLDAKFPTIADFSTPSLRVEASKARIGRTLCATLRPHFATFPAARASRLESAAVVVARRGKNASARSFSVRRRAIPDARSCSATVWHPERVDPWSIGLIVLIIAGLAAIILGALWDRRRNKQRAAEMLAPPARTIPQFHPDAPAPHYLSDLQARRRPEEAESTDLSDLLSAHRSPSNLPIHTR